jgi:nucleoside-diphosphate-sugar epimerase
MNILVTGTEGYIGCRLAPILIAGGHEVVGLDTGYYRDGWLYSDPIALPALPHTLVKDLRVLTQRDLEGIDAVVHLAELSNDPLGNNSPDVTFEINHQGSVNLARMAKDAGVQRFVYASSCSVYGIGTGEFLSEVAPTNPQTVYAKCKVAVERDVQGMADERFCPVFLRNATAYGPSPRMRFDIVLNDLCARAWTEHRIAMTSDGTPWRPLVHIEDICEAIRCAIHAPATLVSGEIFNVGQTSENYRVRELAEIVASVFAGCEVSVGSSAGDTRSYRVAFDKVSTKLPGFRCRWTARQGAEELKTLFERIDFSQEAYQFRAYTRLKQLNYLQRTRQVDERLFWCRD